MHPAEAVLLAATSAMAIVCAIEAARIRPKRPGVPTMMPQEEAVTPVDAEAVADLESVMLADIPDPSPHAPETDFSETDAYAKKRCITCGHPIEAHPVTCAIHRWIASKPGVLPLYRIETLSDFAKVPPDRIYTCLAAFAEWVADCRSVTVRADSETRPAIRPVWTWVDAGDAVHGAGDEPDWA